MTVTKARGLSSGSATRCLHHLGQVIWSLSVLVVPISKMGWITLPWFTWVFWWINIIVVTWVETYISVCRLTNKLSFGLAAIWSLRGNVAFGLRRLLSISSMWWSGAANNPAFNKSGEQLAGSRGWIQTADGERGAAEISPKPHQVVHSATPGAFQKEAKQFM